MHFWPNHLAIHAASQQETNGIKLDIVDPDD